MRIKELEGKIREAADEVEKSSETVERLTAALEEAKKTKSEAEKEWERKATEEAKIRWVVGLDTILKVGFQGAIFACS